MSNAKMLLAGAAIAFTLFGCKSQTSAASAGAASPSGAAASAGSGSVSKQEIADPSLNMNAVEVTIPASWHFQGVLMQGGQCVPTPFAVFRVTSPDGLSMMERMPTLGWRWGTGPMATTGQTDCLPLKSALGAQAYLKYLAATMNLAYVADKPVPADENAPEDTSVLGQHVFNETAVRGRTTDK